MTRVGPVKWLLIESRLVVLFLCCFANYLVPDHDADAFRRIPPESATKNGSGRGWCDVVGGSAADAFTKWDAAHFLHIAEHGYTFEHNLVFAPLFPYAARALGRLTSGVLRLAGCRSAASLSVPLAGVALNTLCVLIAGVALARLTVVMGVATPSGGLEKKTGATAGGGGVKQTIGATPGGRAGSREQLQKATPSGSSETEATPGRAAVKQTRGATPGGGGVKQSGGVTSGGKADEMGAKIALVTTLLFAYSPAGVFFATNYSEALYAALTFSGLLVLYRHAQDSHDVHSSVPMFVRCLKASVFFSLALLTRSNGSLNIGFIACVLLGQLIRYWPLQTNYQRLRLFLLYGVYGFVCVLIVVTPFVLQLYYMRRKFCDEPQALSADVIKTARRFGYIVAGDTRRLEWCTWHSMQMPKLYGYLQWKYWQVGFMRYWAWRKFPLFVLAAPALLIVFGGALTCITALRDRRWRSCVLWATAPRSLFPFVVHAVVIALTAVFVINVEVATRLLFSANPAMYWFCSYLVTKGTLKRDSEVRRRSASYNKIEHDTCDYGAFMILDLWGKTDWLGRMVIDYFLLYFVLGCVLHCNFYPWT